jgi:DNA cross-link repair 1A protein
MITDDPVEAQVHMTSLMEIRSETLMDYLSEFKGSFSRVVGFRPTGWTYSTPKGRDLDQPSISTIVLKWKTTLNALQLKPQRGSTSQAMTYGVPYSEHSSFRDLVCFCMGLDYGRIIPTVNINSAKSRDKMRAFINRWEADKAKHGKLHFMEQVDNWQVSDLKRLAKST